MIHNSVTSTRARGTPRSGVGYDPLDPNRFSAPGCIIASPSFDRNLASIQQNYVFNWTRDAAVAAIEIAAASEPVRLGSCDEQSAAFLAQAGVTADMAPQAATQAVLGVGDGMLQAIVYHTDHLEPSEQFDAVSGFEKSVRNLTWSYAAFLSALRARTGVGG